MRQSGPMSAARSGCAAAVAWYVDSAVGSSRPRSHIITRPALSAALATTASSDTLLDEAGTGRGDAGFDQAWLKTRPLPANPMATAPEAAIRLMFMVGSFRVVLTRKVPHPGLAPVQRRSQSDRSVGNPRPRRSWKRRTTTGPRQMRYSRSSEPLTTMWFRGPVLCHGFDRALRARPCLRVTARSRRSVRSRRCAHDEWTWAGRRGRVARTSAAALEREFVLHVQRYD